MLFLRVVERAGSVLFITAIAFEGSARIQPIDLFGWDVMVLLLVAFPAAVWALASAAVGAIQPNVRRMLWSVGLFALVVPAYFAGAVVGDRIAVAYYGPIIRAAMTEEGQTHSYSYSLGGMVFAASSIVYDEIDSDDPAELRRVAQIGDAGCDPIARRIGPHYYLVNGDC
jgi:hypothetical protein